MKDPKNDHTYFGIVDVQCKGSTESTNLSSLEENLKFTFLPSKFSHQLAEAAAPLCLFTLMNQVLVFNEERGKVALNKRKQNRLSRT